jgi:hypothetical protein
MKAFLIYAITLVIVSFASAGTIAYDDASDAAYVGGGNFNGKNGGFGFLPWQVFPAENGGDTGAFIGSSAMNGSAPSGNIDTDGKSFGFFAYSAVSGFFRQPSHQFGYNESYVLSFDIDTGFVDFGLTCDFNVQNTAPQDNYLLSTRGFQSTYRLFRANQEYDTGIPWTDDGLRVSVEYSWDETLQLKFVTYTVTSLETNQSYSRTDIGSDLHSLQGNNHYGGLGEDHTYFVNRFKIESVPEPSSLLVLAAGLAVGRCLRRRAG